MWQLCWTTEEERLDLHERSLKNIRKRTRMERTRTLPKEMANFDLDEIPPGSGEKTDCRAVIRQHAQVENIVAAVHDACIETQAKVLDRMNQRRLRQDIDRAKLAFAAVGEISPRLPWIPRRKRGEDVIAAFRKAASLLGDREGEWLAQQLPHNLEKEVPRVVVEVGKLEQQIRRILGTTRPTGTGDSLEWNGSALQWLVGERLPQIFERWFRLKVTVEQSKKSLIGSGTKRRYRHWSPYIAFVTAVVTELGKQITPAMIAKLVKAAKRGTRTG